MCDRKSFDDLVALFKQDPKAFDVYVTSHIEDHINEMCADCPEKRERCLQHQWTLDRKLSKFKNPIAKYNAMVEIFWEQVEEFKHMPQTATAPTEQPASILDFKPKNK